MDCFYAAVEMRDQPEYRDTPLAIGGKSPRSVICTANYKAREYGVKSAQPTHLAIKKCPDLVILPPNFSKYKIASSKIHEVFHKFTKLVQPLSLDEAYLDVTHFSKFHGVGGYEIAGLIKKHIYSETNLTASAGVSHLKYLSKIASDWKKPNGIFEVKKEDVLPFLNNLNVKYLPGVGPVTLNKLKKLNIENCLDLRKTDELILTSTFGKYGKRLKLLSNGVDNGEVRPDRVSKSLSVENTFNDNLTLEQLLLELPELNDDFFNRLNKTIRKNQNKRIKSLFVKIKLTNHEKKSLEKSLSEFPILSENLDKSFYGFNHNDQNLAKSFLKIKSKFELAFIQLAKEIFYRFNRPKIRLFGLGIRYHGMESNSHKLDVFDQLYFKLNCP